MSKTCVACTESVSRTTSSLSPSAQEDSLVTKLLTRISKAGIVSKNLSLISLESLGNKTYLGDELSYRSLYHERSRGVRFVVQ